MMHYIICKDCGQADLIDDYDYQVVGCKCNDCIVKVYKRRREEQALLNKAEKTKKGQEDF